ncbi:MAG: efflux RND transporter periplasmic adaptor subunit [Pseudobutyrivibrio sp.]|nr:efflux RND transporter periplasmic adaptor subunit [Pseudobutyrivibrio sp.]
MKNYKYLKRISSVLLLATILLSGCGSEEENVEETKIDVEAESPTVKSISQMGSFIGTIETEEKISVIPNLSGKVTALNYKVGDHVNAGDVLFTLDDREYQIEKRTAEANVRAASATLDAQNIRNREVQVAANEAIGSADAKSIELKNSINNSAREEENSRRKRDSYNSAANSYKDEENRISKMKGEADNRINSANSKISELNSIKSVYDEISSSDDPATVAKNNGVDESDIGSSTDASEIANIYLSKKTQYSSVDEITSAIDSAAEEVKTAENEKKELESSYNNAVVSRVEAEANANIESSNMTSAQEAKKLANRASQDYENYTKKSLISDAQAKVAEGNATKITNESAVTTSTSELEAANLKIENTVIKAPISGIIQEINVKQFEVASDQSVAVVISNPAAKKAVFYVTEEVKNNVKVGQKVLITKNDTEYDAQVANVANTLDEQKKLYKVSATLSADAQAAFDTGQNVKLSTSIKTDNDATTIPVGAVYYSEGKAYVYTVEKNKAIKKDIEVGIVDKNDAEVISGLTQKDKVISNWSSQLKDQSDVNVKKKVEKS